MRIFSFLLFSIITLLSQNSAGQVVEYKIIDSAKGITADQLYTNARAWVAKTFVSANAVLQMDDKQAGKIIGKGNMRTPVKNAFGMVIGDDIINFTITIDVKENKYRVILSDFSHQGGTYKGSANGGSLDREKPACSSIFITKGMWDKIKKEVDKQSAVLLKSLSADMISSNANDNF